MYVHIGKDYILETKNIIGIFDISTLSKEYDSLFQNVEEVIDLSNGLNKTLIITKSKNRTKYYITNIQSTTIGKRVLRDKKYTESNFSL